MKLEFVRLWDERRVVKRPFSISFESARPLGRVAIPKLTGSDLPWNQSDKILALSSNFFLGNVSVQEGADGAKLYFDGPLVEVGS